MDDDGFLQAAMGLTDEAEFQSWYGVWDALPPAGVAAELAGCGVPWWVAGGRAARAGAATARHHEDTDVAVLERDVETVRTAMGGWHLWENVNGELRPLLPGIPVRAKCAQLWVRRHSRSPWRMEFVVDRVSSQDEWVFKRDPSVRLPWDQAALVIDGIRYMRPETALLFKAERNEQKDRDDLAVAQLTGDGRAWLVATLDRLGYAEWARLAR